MKVKDKIIFTTVRTEGAILPADLLQRVVENDKDLDGLKPAAYHLLEGEKLNEAINRSWSHLRGAWLSFQGALEKLSPTDPATSITRERFLLPLFQELGYGRLVAAKALNVEDKPYPISHTWQNTPIHLVGWGVDLDKRTAGVAGASRSSPHSLVQELLNRSDQHLWAFVSNGRKLRILRDNASLTRQAYVEFDLEALMAGEVYADFVLLWLLCHQSRVEAEKPEQCWLEKWSKTADEQGKRALDALRNGVEEAISVLGQGFLSHLNNRELRRRLQTGELNTQDYYRQLLRLVYRLLFLFVAEDRDLLLDPQADQIARDRYTAFYSTARLRKLAEKQRGTHHADLFFGLRLVMEKLGSSEGCPDLGLPALGSLLWSNEFIPDLMGSPSSPSPFSLGEKGNQELPSPSGRGVGGEGSISPPGRGAGGEGQPCQIANADLLQAIRALAFVSDRQSRRPVDYKNLQSEELGSVYESLLELHPELNIDAGTFELKTASGNERKTTGSYYTPDSLVQCLLDSALDPVLDEAVKNAIAPHPPTPSPTRGEGEPDRWEVTAAMRSKMQEVARQFRKEPTQSEAILWEALRNRKLDDRKFRRQQPIGAFVVDFFCAEERLIVEVDGGIHELQRLLDQQRQELLESLGLRLIRVKSQEVESDLSTALNKIRAAFSPLSRSGRGAGGEGNPATNLSPHPLTPSPTWGEGEQGSRTLPSPSGRGAGGEGNPAEAAILNLKVCDPACGSGHFLIAAAHRMAKRLAVIRTGDEEPAPEAIRTALRDVIGRCIYGVDVNPMAVELCKVALWMESLEPGKPLSFLDHHIQCGNSLLGATPALLRKGIPDEAFTPIEGDDKAYCSKYKKQNKQEREKGQLTLLDERNEPWERLGDLATSLVNLNQIADDDIVGVQRKETQYEKFVKSTPYLFSRFWADAWCAAFVWKKRQSEELLYPITDEVFRQIERNPFNAPDWMRREVERLRDQYKFFHWHLAFPDVFEASDTAENEQSGWDGGFSIVLGNPPWERLQFEERAFFASRYPSIHAEGSQAKRKQMIEQLKDADPRLYQSWADTRRQTEGEATFLRSSNRFPLSAVDKFNLYAIFSELSLSIYSINGRSGIIVKAGLITDKLCSVLFSEAFRSNQLFSIFEFENRLKLFPNVDSRERFILLTFGRRVEKADFCFEVLTIEDLKDGIKHIQMSYEDVVLLSPNTKNCLNFPDRREFEIAKKCYEYYPHLVRYEPPANPWKLYIDRYINVSDFSDEILTSKDLNEVVPANFFSESSLVPIYEGKLIHQYDHRYATYSIKGESRTLDVSEKSASSSVICCRFISREIALRRNPNLRNTSGLIAIRDITNRTNERGIIAAIIPPNITDYTVRVIRTDLAPTKQAILLSALNSFIVDYLARQRIGGTHLSNYILEQTPILAPDKFTANDSNLILPRVLELTYTAWDLQPFAQDCGYNGAPFRWDEERRFLLRCELDAAYFHLYGIQRDDVDYIMETFPIVKRKDEKAHGHYRTKDTILEIYDAMAEAMKTGQPYQTLLDPPPADPSVAHPPR